MGHSRGVRESGRFHQLHILLILGGGAAGHLVHPRADMLFAEAAEAVEGGEKLVMPAEAGCADKAAHGEGVNHAVVKLLVGGELRGRRQRRRAGLFDQIALVVAGKLGLRRINAQPVFARVADKALGIDRAGKMDVQVGALGELVQKSAQGRRAVMRGGLVSAGGAGFRRRRLSVKRGSCGGEG